MGICTTLFLEEYSIVGCHLDQQRSGLPHTADVLQRIRREAINILPSDLFDIQINFKRDERNVLHIGNSDGFYELRSSKYGEFRFH